MGISRIAHFFRQWTHLNTYFFLQVYYRIFFFYCNAPIFILFLLLFVNSVQFILTQKKKQKMCSAWIAWETLSDNVPKSLQWMTVDGEEELGPQRWDL